MKTAEEFSAEAKAIVQRYADAVRDPYNAYVNDAAKMIEELLASDLSREIKNAIANQMINDTERLINQIGD